MRMVSSRTTSMLLLLALVLAAVDAHPLRAAAQDDAGRFNEALALRETTASLAGPLSGDLTQATGFVTNQGAGVSTDSFIASATFSNPADPGLAPWDIGFVFHRTPEAVQQIVFDSGGTWYYSPWPAGTQSSGAVAFDAAPGGSNTVDLVVDGSTALFGLNGQFVAAAELPTPVTADVEVGTGFFTNTTENGRVIPYTNFQVWPLSATSIPSGVPATESPSGGTSPLPPLADLLNSGRAPGTPAGAVIPIVTPTVPSTPAPPSVSTEEATRFAAVLAGQEALPPLAGPFTANLKEALDFIALSYANVSVTDFHAHAVTTVPSDASSVLWDTGFRFRFASGGDFRVTVNSAGTWSFAIGTELPARSGSVANLVTAPGGENTLDLLVEGQRAWFGVNGELAATIDLPEGGAPSDVALGAGFYYDEISTDRVTLFREFAVRELAAGTLAGSAGPATPAVETEPPADDREAFAGYLAATANTEPAAGPTAGQLAESTPGMAPLANAGVTLADFAAVAQVDNPSGSGESLWDAGFLFRASGSERNVIVVDSLGDVYATLPGSSTMKIGSAVWYNANPGARNTLQLFVAGNRAYVGVNNQFVTAVDLLAAPVASDVSLVAGFYTEDFVVGRVTDYRDFSVWELT